jgi:hypothetical protein
MMLFELPPDSNQLRGIKTNVMIEIKSVFKRKMY